jgi:hypothetical protein
MRALSPSRIQLAGAPTDRYLCLEDQNINAFKVHTPESAPHPKLATVTRSMAKMTLWLGTILLATAPTFAQLASVPDTYIGIWRRYFNGKVAGTVQLVNYKGKLTGIFSGSTGTLDDKGVVQMYGTPGGVPIVESSLSGSDLHLVIAGPFDTTNELKMTLTGPDKAHLTCYGNHGRVVEFDLKKVPNEEDDAMHVEY